MDIRRTLLWMILSFSLLLLWNNWQVYQGKPSLFGESATQTTEESTPAKTASADTSIPSDAPVSTPPSNTSELTQAVPGAAQTGEKVTVATDVLTLTFDTLGAQLVRAELPKYAAEGDKSKHMVLLDNSDELVYLAQTGIVGAPQGQSFPTHLTPFRLVTPSPEFKGDTMDVVFEAQSGGLRVLKTYTLHRDNYAITVRHE